MNFEQKNVKRTIRDFKRSISALLNAEHQVYQSRLEEMMSLIKTDVILFHIVGGYLELPVNRKEIEDEYGGRYKLRLPKDRDMQIAYVLQIMDKSSKGEFQMDMYAFHIFRQKRMNDNLYSWNKQILTPCLEALIDKLDDLTEDEVEGKQNIPSSSLMIVNSTITNTNGNFALGNDIIQTLTIGEISKAIVKEALEKEIITAEQEPEVKQVADEIEQELRQEKPSQTKLQVLTKRLYDIGEKALIGIAVKTITDVNFQQAVTTVLLSI